MESAIANHQKIVTVIPCLLFLLGMELVLDTEIFTDTKLLLTTSWSDPVDFLLFCFGYLWLLSVNVQKQHIIQVKNHPCSTIKNTESQ